MAQLHLPAEFSSKKFRMAAAAALTAVSGFLAGAIDSHTMVVAIVGALSAGVVGQGIADNGKEAAKINKGVS